MSGGFKILTRTERHAFLFFFNLDETLHLVQVNLYVFTFNARALFFLGMGLNQSEARKYCFLASDWLKFETLTKNT